MSLERGVCSCAEWHVLSYLSLLCLVQRLKGSMSGDVYDFSNIETQTVVKFFFLQIKSPNEIHAILRETLEEYAPSCATVKNWMTQFKLGNFSNCYASRPGRHKLVTSPQIIDEIHELFLENSQISAENWALT